MIFAASNSGVRITPTSIFLCPQTSDTVWISATWFCERCDIEGVAIADLDNETITMIAEEIVDPSWSPDGAQLVASAGSSGEEKLEGLVVLDLQGKSRPLIFGDVSSPAWQPVR